MDNPEQFTIKKRVPKEVAAEEKEEAAEEFSPVKNKRTAQVRPAKPKAAPKTKTKPLATPPPPVKKAVVKPAAKKTPAAPAVNKTQAPKKKAPPAPEPTPPPAPVPEAPPVHAAEPQPTAPPPTPPSPPTEQDKAAPAPTPAVLPDKSTAAALVKDVAYYHRIADKKKMAANDRLYVLYRLKDKYAGKNVELTSLLGEIDKWETAKRSGVPPAPAPAPEDQEKKSPATASPVEQVQIPAWEDYVLQNGDLLDIRVAPAKELDRELAVQPDGSISFPLLGSLPAEGLTRVALERSLTQKLAAYVIEPKITVTVRRFASDAVIVTGRVPSPGAVAHKEDMNALDAITAAGGFLGDADRSGVYIYRGREQNRETFLVDADLRRGDPNNLPLRPGDIVDVQQARDVSILGMVAKPGNYAFRKDLSLLDLVFESGGLTAGAKAKSVFLYSQSDAGRKSKRINLDRIMSRSPGDDPRLRPGDIVMVPQRAFYGAAGSSNSVLTNLFYLSTIVIAVVLATKD